MTNEISFGPSEAMAGKTLKERVASNLKRARMALKLKPVDICRRTGIADNTYSQWESADRIPEITQAFRLCDNLGYTMDWIYRGIASDLPARIANHLPPEDADEE